MHSLLLNVQVLGALYGPYYIYLGLGDSGAEDNLGYALCFAVAIQLTISGLYHVMLGYVAFDTVVLSPLTPTNNV